MLKLIIVMLTSLFLVGCESSNSPEYLLQHPEELQNQLMVCQQNNVKTAFCDAIMKMSTEFAAMIADHNDDPAKFGMKIMEAESDLAKAELTVQQTQQAYNKILTGHVLGDDQTKAKEKLAKAQEDYQNQLRKVQMMLAVVR